MRGKVLVALAIACACTLTGTATAAPAQAGGTVHLIDYTDNDAAATTAVLTGAVGDLGQGVSVNPDGTLSTGHAQLNLVLSQGTFRIDTVSIDQRFLAAASATPFQHGPESCSGYVSVEGSAPIVAGSGTGAYRGITGIFHLTMTLNEVDAPTGNGQCDVTGALLGQIIVIEGTATVAFSG